MERAGVLTSLPLAPIDLNEAMKDSPRFRHSLSLHSAHLSRLESRLSEVLKLASAMNELGQNYVSTFYKLSVCVNHLSDEAFSGSALTRPALSSISEAYARTVHLSRQFHESSCSLLYNKISQFVKNELSKLADARVHFESLSASMDEALARNAAVSRAKPAELAESRNALTSVATCFAHTTLDYVAHINSAHAHKNHIVVDALWDLVKEYSSFFRRGHAIFDEWTAEENGTIADSLSTLSAAAKNVERRMQDIHSLVNNAVLLSPSGMSPEPDVVMEGYLYKRSSNAFRSWNRRWFQIKDCKLLYSHRSPECEEPTIMEENLMLCLVRPASAGVDRNNCFELVTPTKTHILQADNGDLCNSWMRALQRTILHLHESSEKTRSADENELNESCAGLTPLCLSTPSPSSSSSIPLPPPSSPPFRLQDRLLAIPGNNSCADCGAADPKWVSINLGVLVCIECAGQHRSLGVHFSKIRSVTMDSVEEETGRMLLLLGNSRVNAVFLSALPPSNGSPSPLSPLSDSLLPSPSLIPPPARPDSSREAREAWIKAKYVERKFVARPVPKRQEPTRSRSPITRSVSDDDLKKDALTENPIHWRDSPSNSLNSEDRQTRGQAIVATDSSMAESDVDSGMGETASIFLEMTPTRVVEAAAKGDLLFLLSALARGANLNTANQGITPLHAAVNKAQASAVEFLLLNGAKWDVVDDLKNTALHIAAKEGRALQVCQLLRRGADREVCNSDGLTPLQLAVEHVHADIVTVLRLHNARDELAQEFDNPMDETLSRIVSDITRKTAAVAKSAT